VIRSRVFMISYAAIGRSLRNSLPKILARPGMADNRPCPTGGLRHVRMNPIALRDNRESSTLKTIFAALSRVPGVHAEMCREIPAQCLAVDGRVVAFVDDLDAWDSLAAGKTSDLMRSIDAVKPAIVFKVQYRSGTVYPVGTVSAGYFCHPLAPAGASQNNLLHRDRPIDVTSRMRISEYPGPPQPWMPERRTIVKEAEALARCGYAAVHGRIALRQYIEELPAAQIGFHWRGYGRLCYRLIEYISAGVVPITEPLGKEWPVREDVTIEDGITCVVCDQPSRFGAEAKALLRDRRKLKRIRGNLCELWTSRLALPAMGQWYWERLKRAHLILMKDSRQ
jgi:hypothetical protein